MKAVGTLGTIYLTDCFLINIISFMKKNKIINSDLPHRHDGHDAKGPKEERPSRSSTNSRGERIADVNDIIAY
jgi:hypothetical protein